MKSSASSAPGSGVLSVKGMPSLILGIPVAVLPIVLLLCERKHSRDWRLR
jgi:hypothetical protein